MAEDEAAAAAGVPLDPFDEFDPNGHPMSVALNPSKLSRLALNVFTLSPKQKPIHFYGGQLNGVPTKLVGAIYRKVKLGFIFILYFKCVFLSSDDHSR